MPKRKTTNREKESGIRVCPDCMQDTRIQACHIDFHAVWVSLEVHKFMQACGRIPTNEELKKMDEEFSTDPCDTCCCGACGSRKNPGDICC